jgi:hypothetical protein
LGGGAVRGGVGVEVAQDIIGEKKKNFTTKSTKGTKSAKVWVLI